MKHLLLILCFLGLMSGCATEIDYPNLGNKVAGPRAVALSQTGNHFYAINSDSEFIYNEGSMLVLDAEGNKVKVVSIPRLASTVEVAGDRLMVTTQTTVGPESAPAKVGLFDVSDETDPKELDMVNIDCSPVAITFSSDYQYFPLSCENGDLYIGTFAADRNSFTLKRVRSYHYSRHAVYLNGANGMVYMFPTNGPTFRGADNQILTDKVSYDENDKLINTPNQFPDRFESTAGLRRDPQSGSVLLGVAYSIANESAEFQYKDLIEDPEVESELFPVYFDLDDKDGNKDAYTALANEDQNVYRTNFVRARPDPAGDKNTFYLAQAANIITSQIPYNNNILKVSISPASSEGSIAAGSSFLSFERVYGFKDDLPSQPTIFDFQITDVGGKQVALVNHFRVPVNNVSDASFTLSHKGLGDAAAAQNLSSRTASSSYISGAVNQNGVGLTGSFYNNSLLLFELSPGSAITIKQTIK